MDCEDDSRPGFEWRGQSATVAVVLLVGVTLVLVAAVSVFVFGVFDDGGGGDDPVIVSIESDIVGNELEIRHRAGNRLDPEEVTVRIQGTTTTTDPIADLDNTASTNGFEAGDSATIPVDPTDPQFDNEFRVVVVHEPTNAVLHDKGYSAVTAAVFEFDSTTFPSTALDAGTNAQVSFTLNNTGDTPGSGTVTLRRNGTSVNTTSAQLAASETAARTLNYTTRDADAPAIRLTLATGSETAAKTVTVDGPVLEFESTSFPDDVDAGNNATVDFTVENTGTRDGSRTVELLRNGTVVNSTSVSLNTDKTASETLNYTTAASDTPAINLTLDTGDDTAESTVNVTSTPTVYVGSNDGTLYAVNATDGTKQWEFTTGGPVESSPTVVDGTVYVGSNDDTLYAVDASSGTKEWAFTNPSAAVESSPTVVDGTVYVGSNDDTLYAVNATDGSQTWAFTEPSRAVVSSPTVANGTVYVGSNNGTVYAVDASAGVEEWNVTTNKNFGLGVTSSPTTSGGTVYVGTPTGAGAQSNTLVALDATTGNTKWTVDVPNGVRRSSPTVESGSVYIGTEGSRISAIDTAGDYAWNQSAPATPVRSSPTVAGGTVYVGNNESSASGALFALNAGDDTEQWVFTDSGSAAGVDSSPTVANGTVYVGSNDGTLYAVDAPTGDEKWEFSTGGAVESSPTVVTTPAVGSSTGSRVRQETLGHHDE